MRLKGLLAGGVVVGWCAATAVAAGKPAPKPKAPARPVAPTAQPAAPAPAADANISPEAAEFFEKNVRPVLLDKCGSCHGDKMQQAGVRVDMLAGLTKGTDTGHVVLKPGDPDHSGLIQAIRWTGPVKMPPAGKLDDKQIEALTQWVKMGAPWPGGSAQAAPTAADKAKAHWAFQPVRKPAMPALKSKTWAKGPIDALVLKKLEAKGLTPAKPADRRTLIRRAYFDIIGLPPTEEQVQAFLKDTSPNAWAKVVDELLASPHYGERWGRYWLDIARYADTKGYVFTEERKYPYAYTYRDWVINSLNADLPYDQFITEQIAADQVASNNDRHALAAMGFLTLGRRFLNNQPDIIDDRMDVVFRGTQALTVGCARCHDHKFDPIPTKDYYSLYGVFASSRDDEPLLDAPEKTAAYVEFEKGLNERQAKVNDFLDQKFGEVMAHAKGKIGAALMAAHEVAGGGDLAAVAQKADLPAPMIQRWMTFLNATRVGHAVFAPWHALSAIPEGQWTAQAPAILQKIAADQFGTPINAGIKEMLAAGTPTSLQDVADRYQKLLADPPQRDQQLLHALDSIGGPFNLTPDEVSPFLTSGDRQHLLELRMAVDSFKANSPAAPPRAMALADLPNPVTPRVFLRGNQNNPGPEVPRQFLAVLAGPDRKPFEKGSGRLELAQQITSKSNPLTARVMMNRVWMWHFGSPLVRTPSDFGLRSEPPTNPELLDYLAWRFMDNNWSLKKMHREILLSATYQQSSMDRPECRAKDPENALYWRMNRRRLDFETMRDYLLNAGGDLDPAVGGPSIDVQARPFPTRRTVYAFIDRQNLPGLMRSFDYASPDQTSPGRFVTTVPQQALFLMNSPFIVEQARKLAARPEVTGAKTPSDRVQQFYRVCFQRDATPDEVQLGLKFLKSLEPAQAPATPAEVWQYGCGAVDESGHVKSFERFAQFTGTAWQGGKELPDAKTGWSMLTSTGGHAGNDQQHCTIRRWIAHKDGVVSITGLLGHSSDEGDGVRARIISSRAGVVGTWEVHHSREKTEVAQVPVKAGDTIDFVVDCKQNVSFDSFTWAPGVHQQGGEEWSAITGFSGPTDAVQGLSPWEKYAQVLMISNEFFFVD